MTAQPPTMHAPLNGPCPHCCAITTDDGPSRQSVTCLHCGQRLSKTTPPVTVEIAETVRRVRVVRLAVDAAQRAQLELLAEADDADILSVYVDHLADLPGAETVALTAVDTVDPERTVLGVRDADGRYVWER